MSGGDTERQIKRKEVEPMARQKKKGSQEKTLKIIILATAILNLIRALVDLIEKLTE